MREEFQDSGNHLASDSFEPMKQQLFNASQVHTFRTNLLAWFDIHKRDLPWRRTRDPYAIWVSEVMLQQTRVAAVLEHYAHWMRRFPTIAALAAASEDEVLAGWSGLGYYRRARFLHKGAKAVVANHNGKLPKTAAELRNLPGIGAYTSAAIASIAFGEAAAVVDGNVERVLLRHTGAAEEGTVAKSASRITLNAIEIQKLATQLIDTQRPGDFNQAMMDLGATVCLPRKPLCLQCPVQASCRTRGEHPTPQRKPSSTADIAFALIQRKRRSADEVLLQQRPATATIMPGMWELPLLPQNSSQAISNPGKPLLILRHAIMQTNYRAAVIQFPAKTSSLPKPSASQKWIKLTDLASLPLTGLARKILLRLDMHRPHRATLN
jgi:A/G-specific adenine glycosylase